jgi:hypothetical protein
MIMELKNRLCSFKILLSLFQKMEGRSGAGAAKTTGGQTEFFLY